MNHAAAAVLFLLPFVPAQPSLDSDVDGVADDRDVCAGGDDNVDTDNDGAPDACDCAPTDPAVGPLAPDVCDGVDNNCDGRVDRYTLFNVRGAELFGRVGLGFAEANSTRNLSISGQNLSVGSGLISEVYYQEELDLVTAAGVREVTVRLERVATNGDNDVEVAFTDGTRTIAYGIFNDDNVAVRYIAAAHAGVMTGNQFTSAYPLRPAEDVYWYDNGQTYFMTFRATAAGTSVSLRGNGGFGLARSPVTFPLADSLDPNVPWTLLLIGNSPAETYTIERLAVDQPLPAPGGTDADGDGFPVSCDCADDDPLVNPGALEGCDGLDRDCRPQTFVEEQTAVFSRTGSKLVDDLNDGLARKHAGRTVTAVGTSLVVAPAASGSSQAYYRRTLPLSVPTGDDALEVLVEVDRVAAAGNHDFEVGLAFGLGNGEPRVFTAGLHDTDGSTGARYAVSGRYGELYPNQDVNFTTPVTSGVVLDEAGPWLFTFEVLPTSVTAEVRSATGQTATLTYPTPPGTGTGPLELVLVAPAAGHSFTVKSLDVSLEPSDVDDDGICDFRDWCAGFDGVVDQDGDGVPNGCDCNDLRAEVGPHAAEVCDGRDRDCDGQIDFLRLAGGAGTEMAAQITRGQATGPSGAWTYVDERTVDTAYGYENGYAKNLGDIRRADGTTTLRLRLNLHGRKLLALSDGSRAIALDQSSTSAWISTRIEASLSPTWRLHGGFVGPQCLSAYGPHNSSCTFGAVTAYPDASADDVIEVLFVADADGQRIVNTQPWSGWYNVPGYTAIPQGNVAVIPPNAQLDLSRPIKAWMFGSMLTEASVSAALDDDDADLVCDARDVCEGQDDRLDADLDGVPDACDMCYGADGAFDVDGDGFPSGCDCDDNDAARHPDQRDVCDYIDNDCDLKIDLDTLLSVRGVELSSQLLRGEATGVATRAVSAILEGRAVRVAPSTSSVSGEVYYRRSLGAVRIDQGETRVVVRVDRAPEPGDHDFHVALSDGQTAFGLSLQDAGNSLGLSYQALAFTAADTGTTVLPSAYGQGEIHDDATPYEVDFVFGADPRLEVLTARNQRFTLRPSNPQAVAGMSLDDLDVLLIAHQPAESYTVRSLEVRQRLEDADLDGVCDAVDFCPGGDDTGLDSDGDGIVDACDVCAFGPDDEDADGDGVPDACDLCDGGDDLSDADDDSIPDACDVCPDDYANDADGDGVCDLGDACFGFDDGEDFDGDGVADGCDRCPLDADNDSDEDGSCDAADVCKGNDRSGDKDGDGWCADLDCDDTRAHVHRGAPEVCDGYDSNCDGELDLTEMDLDQDGIIDCVAALAAEADAGPEDAGDGPPAEPGCGCSQGGEGTPTAPWGLALLGVLALSIRRRVVVRRATSGR